MVVADTGLHLSLPSKRAKGVRDMSLNRSEQLVCDYVEDHPEEKRFWMEKVRSIAHAERDDHAAAVSVAEELWRYFEERAGVVASFQELARGGGLRPTNMRNLAEYWLRLWIDPRPKKRSSGQPYA